MTTKVDFKKTVESYRATRGKFQLLTVPPLQYLMIDGHGDPNTVPAYRQAIETLYPLAYTMKFHSKQELGRDYVVPPLEGLWWADDMTVFTTARDKSQWSWTLLLMTPSWLDQHVVELAMARVAAQKTLPLLSEVRFETLTEGRCVQTLHIGPYDDEGPVLAQLHDEFLPAQGLRPIGTHHEIYLSEPRRAAPEKLRTILRQPVTTA